MAVDIKGIENRIHSTDALGPRSRSEGLDKDSGGKFSETLKGLQENKNIQTRPIGGEEGLKFSNHAVDRVQSRGIRLGPDLISKMEAAVKSASAKGAKEMLILADEAAFIVSVKNNTVVTAMDKATLKENVFTNIDSTVVI